MDQGGQDGRRQEIGEHGIWHKRARQRFPSEFKDEAVRLVETSDRPLEAVARELGVHPNNLRNWRKARLAAGSAAALEQQKTDAAELIRLRREVSQLREEKEILKKAVSFFASPQPREGKP